MSDKQCTKCGELKLFTDFNKNRRYKDGLIPWCKPCKAEYTKSWRASNKDRALNVTREYRQRKAEHIKASAKQWRERNKERERERDLRRRRSNPEGHRRRVKAWADGNREKLNSVYAQRRARSKSATPPWLTQVERGRILLKYKEAKVMSLLTGIRHEVDHVIPLNGKSVSGLHVPWNLRVIPARENKRKSKKFLERLALGITMM